VDHLPNCDGRYCSKYDAVEEARQDDAAEDYGNPRRRTWAQKEVSLRYQNA